MAILIPRVITLPDDPIIDLDIVEKSIKWNHGVPESVLLRRWLRSARELAQQYTGRPIGDQVLEIAMDRFPCGDIELPLSPVKSIVSVSYVDESNVEQVLHESLYTLDQYKDPCWLVRRVGTAWPSTYPTINAVKVRYLAGFEHGVPDAVQTGILMLVGHQDQNRQATAPIQLHEIPLGAREHFDTVRDWSY